MSSFLKLILGVIIDKIAELALKFWKKKQKTEEDKAENKEAIDKAKKSKTIEEVDDALDDILDSTFD